MTEKEFENTLRTNNHRVTQARKEIFRLLQKSQKSLSPREIFENINSMSGTDLVSVYRNLTLFQELGLAHRFQDGSFASCLHEHQDHSHRHIHIISHCVKCGQKSEIQSHSEAICSLAEEIGKLSQALSLVNEIVIQGHCINCID